MESLAVYFDVVYLFSHNFSPSGHFSTKVALYEFYYMVRNVSTTKIRKHPELVEQPSSQMVFKGDWGCFPNKQFAKI